MCFRAGVRHAHRTGGVLSQDTGCDSKAEDHVVRQLSRQGGGLLSKDTVNRRLWRIHTVVVRRLSRQGQGGGSGGVPPSRRGCEGHGSCPAMPLRYDSSGKWLF